MAARRDDPSTATFGTYQIEDRIFKINRRDFLELRGAISSKQLTIVLQISCRRAVSFDSTSFFHGGLELVRFSFLGLFLLREICFLRFLVALAAAAWLEAQGCRQSHQRRRHRRLWSIGTGTIGIGARIVGGRIVAWR
jgi:hypothetical protein